MKNFIKGMITGLLLGSIIVSVPILAENIDVLFNTVRININGMDEIQWNNEIELANGSTVPSSILYNGTTYLPIRKISECMNNEVYWNGDTNTVSITRQKQNIKTITEKPDSYGHLWEYYTFTDEKGNHYIGAKDDTRKYDRVYLIAGDSIRITENEIYFVRLYGGSYWFGQLTKLSFANDPNTQDGTEIKKLELKSPYGAEEWFYGHLEKDCVIFDGDYLYYACNFQSNASPHGQLIAYNYITDEKTVYTTNIRTNITNIKLVDSGEQTAAIDCIVHNYAGAESIQRITFDKVNHTLQKINEKASNEI